MLILYEREVTDMGYNNYNNYSNNNYNNRNNRNNNSNRKSSYQKVEPLPYTKLSNKNYVDLAEKVIKHIKYIKKIEKTTDIITTTKLRSILSLNSEIYNMVTHDSKEKLSEEIEAKIQYLKVKVVYEMGREVSVKIFCENAHLLECINDIDGTKTSYILFARYLEALVAFRKYIIGKDK